MYYQIKISVLCFETESPVAQAGLKFLTWPRMTVNSGCSDFHLLSVRTTGMCHCAQLHILFITWLNYLMQWGKSEVLAYQPTAAEKLAAKNALLPLKRSYSCWGLCGSIIYNCLPGTYTIVYNSTTQEDTEWKKTDLHLLITALMDDNGPWLEKEREKMHYTFINPENRFSTMPGHGRGMSH